MNDDVISQLIKYLHYPDMINFLNSCKRLKDTKSREIFSSIYSVIKDLATKELKMLISVNTPPAKNFNHLLEFHYKKCRRGEIFIKAKSDLSILFPLNMRSTLSRNRHKIENLKLRISDIRNIPLESAIIKYYNINYLQ